MDRKHPLAKCEECPLQKEKYVPTVGPEDASVAFVGEAPGREEARKATPFVGASGRLLNAVLSEYGIERDSVALTNTVLCRPPDNRTPTKVEISCCSERLRNDLESRTHIVSLGGTASSAVMGKQVKITSFRAGPPKTSPLYDNAKVIPTFHPAACLRAADYFPSLASDIGKLVNELPTWTEPKYVVY